MVNQTFKLGATMLTLVGLYLFLRNSTGATALLRAGFEGWSGVLRTLQGR